MNEARSAHSPALAGPAPVPGAPVSIHAAPWTAASRGPAPHPPAPSAAPSGDVFSLLLPPIRRAVAEEGYTTPTPVQVQSIPHLLTGRDLLGCAQTGTGKTAAFVLPILQHLVTHPRPAASMRPRVLILAPTRELAAQIGDSVKTYGRHVRGVTHTVIFGGVGQNPQVQALRRGVDIAIATPGRLLDLMQQGFARLDAVEIFVLDEADRMLDMGFIRDIRKVIAALPARRQSLFFSATLAPEVVELARTLVRDAVHVAIRPEAPAVERIAQSVMFVDKPRKDDLLAHLLRDPGIDRVIVFTRMKHIANRVAEKLGRVGVPASAIHGNKSQSARTSALAGFKAGRVRVLVATDIAARGIDVDGITHVINYDLPAEPETYVHRIGRTARAGADGDAISFCCAEERDDLRSIERLVRRPVPVESAHPFHSETARNATGAAARPPPKTGRGQPGRSHAAPRGGHGGGGHPGGGHGARPFRGVRSFGSVRR
ncbi:MAG: DEAD/DEAH box helicase [Lentisphaerae bacterium]|nr:DEAD/DEAH box helicase [Lentisphaerota bacterium]